MTLKLESTNIEELRKEIPVEKISQTFRDAFTTTRQLGFRYIWADSLCIMQDHQFQEGLQDWLTESARMGENYKHAALTIAPTPKVDKVDVFFSNRDTPQRIPLAVNIKRKAPTHMNLISCGKTEVDVSGQYYCFSKDIWLSQVDRAPLNHRGWVYQERLLSPRTVHFAADVFWECRQRIASEMLPTGFPYLEEDGLPVNTKCWRGKTYGPSKFLGKYGKWMEFVEKFSYCHLTMDRDKLPAIAGVAAVFESPNDQYLAGLWRGGLASQLIWRRSEKRWTNYEPPLNYRAPSWSWASVNGPIEFLADTFYIDRRSRYTAAIIDCNVDLLVVNNPLGQVTGAQLCLRADLAHISPHRIAQNPEWMLTLDDNKEYMRVVTYYLCVFTAHVSWCNDLFLLVLEPTGAKSEEFRRIGVLMIRLGNNIPAEGFKVFPDCTITII
ncbi:heterokaryon incompatibility protein [Fusarium napiforme]|uniref:Heterokaryon incompatibility protein n=1 Tax=Fusarium napiforme TaxID=42672 RepID=A0A8H5NIM6_9HYPO|nr:heterokaryon incompatibility protein [Fusarium napiforme]